MSRDDLMMRLGVVLFALVLLVIVGLPLWSLLVKGFEDRDGKFVGLANYVAYFSTPALFDSALNSLHVSAVCTLIVVPLAFFYAYALTRTVLPVRWLFQGISLIPIFAPSLLPGLALVYLFGNQGFFKGMLGGPIYGFDGIVIAQIFYCFPHATLILVTALATADARLYEAADALGASKLQTIFRVVFPAAISGILAAVLLGLGRVIGETMVVLLVAGNRIEIPDFTEGLGVFFQPAHTLTGIIAQELGEVPFGSVHYRALFVVGMVLFVMVLGINWTAQRMLHKFRISHE